MVMRTRNSSNLPFFWTKKEKDNK